MSSYLLEQIIKITGDKKSEKYYEKAIKILGPGIVETELGELKSQILEGTIKKKYINNKGAYLTTLLKKQMNKFERPKTIIKTSRPKTHYEKTQQDLFQNLKPVEVPEITGEPKKMPVSFSGKDIPFTTFLSASFFTLSTNKKRSDKVSTIFRTLDGVVTEVPLLRGRIRPGSKEYGIPTAQHMKVLAALKLAWSQKESNYTEYSNGPSICYLTIFARELAKLLFWKKFGGRELKRLTNLVTDLKSMPYYLFLEGANITGLKGYGFYLLDEVSLIDGKSRGGVQAVYHITFSSTVSWQLLKRHAVIRPKAMLGIRSELASLLWLYLEPNLRAHNEVCINLKNLIKVLHLPKAGWQKYKFKRKEQFSKAIEKLNGQKLADDRKMTLEIKPGLQDWQLIARLETAKIGSNSA